MPRYTSTEKYYSNRRSFNDYYGSGKTVDRRFLELNEIVGIGDLTPTITWSSAKVPAVDLFLSVDDAPFVLWESAIPNINQYTFTFRWFYENCRIKIVDSSDPNLFSVSNYFTYLFIPRVAFFSDLITPAPAYNNSVAFLGDQITEPNPPTTGILGNFGFGITESNPPTTGIVGNFGEKII